MKHTYDKKPEPQSDNTHKTPPEGASQGSSDAGDGPGPAHFLPPDLVPSAFDWLMMNREFDERLQKELVHYVATGPGLEVHYRTAKKIARRSREALQAWRERVAAHPTLTGDQLAAFQEEARVLKQHALYAFFDCEQQIAPERYNRLSTDDAIEKWKAEASKVEKLPDFPPVQAGREFSELTLPQKMAFSLNLWDGGLNAFYSPSYVAESKRLFRVVDRGPDMRVITDLNGFLRPGENPVDPPLKPGYFNALLQPPRTAYPAAGNQGPARRSGPGGVDAASLPAARGKTRGKVMGRGEPITPAPPPTSAPALAPMPAAGGNTTHLEKEKRDFYLYLRAKEQTGTDIDFSGGTVLVSDGNGNGTLHSVYDLPAFRDPAYNVTYDPTFSDAEVTLLNQYRESGFQAPPPGPVYQQFEWLSKKGVDAYGTMVKKFNSHELNVYRFIEKYVQDTINEFHLNATLTPQSKVAVRSPGERVNG